MGVKEIIEILQTSSLDHETKIKIIDFLSVNNDQHKVNDLSELLVAWQAADVKEEDDFKAKLLVLIKKFEDDLNKIDNKTLRAENKILDELETAQKIEVIKKQISS